MYRFITFILCQTPTDLCCSGCNPSAKGKFIRSSLHSISARHNRAKFNSNMRFGLFSVLDSVFVSLRAELYSSKIIILSLFSTGCFHSQNTQSRLEFNHPDTLGIFSKLIRQSSFLLNLFLLFLSQALLI